VGALATGADIWWGMVVLGRAEEAPVPAPQNGNQ
jgi:hypothetical protein